MNAQGSDDDTEHGNSDLDYAETDLESFSTVLEANSGIDEFQIFCVSLQRKFNQIDRSFLCIKMRIFQL